MFKLQTKARQEILEDAVKHCERCHTDVARYAYEDHVCEEPACDRQPD